MLLAIIYVATAFALRVLLHALEAFAAGELDFGRLVPVFVATAALVATAAALHAP